MDRREALKRVGYLMGGVVSAPLASAVLSGCRAGTSGTGPWAPRSLSATQNDLVVAASELIIPETDTPGAKAAGVNEFIDLMMSDWYPADMRDAFLAGVDDLDARAEALHGKSFLEASEEEQTAVLQALESEGMATGGPPSFFAMLKELTITGYYTSEVGATQE
jgi:hypothetical protein